MRVSYPDCSPFMIHRCDVAQAPTRFLEIVRDSDAVPEDSGRAAPTILRALCGVPPSVVTDDGGACKTRQHAQNDSPHYFLCRA